MKLTSKAYVVIPTINKESAKFILADIIERTDYSAHIYIPKEGD